MTDTHPAMQRLLIEGYRKMTPREKMRRVDDLNRAIQHMALARIKAQYGEISEREQMLRLAALWLDRELMMRVFQWDPQEKGY